MRDIFIRDYAGAQSSIIIFILHFGIVIILNTYGVSDQCLDMGRPA